MESVVLIIHLILALCLIAAVLLQRSEGGALGIGGGGGGGLVSARGAGNALSKLTWGLAVAFIVTSILLTILSGRGEVERSVVDDFSQPLQEGQSIPLPGDGSDGGLGGLDDAGSLLPPAEDGDTPAPPAAD